MGYFRDRLEPTMYFWSIYVSFYFYCFVFFVCVCAVLGWGRVCVRRRHHPGHRRLPRAQSNLGQQQYQLWQRGHCLSGPLRSCNLQGLDQYYVRRNGHQAGGYLKQEEDYHWNTCNKNLGWFIFPFHFLGQYLTENDRETTYPNLEWTD